MLENNPKIIQEPKRRSFSSVEVGDELVMQNEARRSRGVQREFNKLNKAVDELKISGTDATEQIQQTEIIKQESIENGTSVGNLMPDSVPNSIDESNEETKKHVLMRNEETRQHVLMLYSILTAAERTISCILEKYQGEDGVEIPELLQPLMDGKRFLPFKATKNKD